MTEASAPTPADLDACYRAVETLCTQRGLGPCRLESSIENYLGVQLQGVTHPWNLDISCTSGVITKLPNVYLRSTGELRAHVSYAGSVCVSDNQGLSLDPDRRPDIVAFTVLTAYDLLERWDKDAQANIAEFYNELEGYWLGLPASARARAAMDVDGRDRLVSAYLNARTKPARWYFVERDAKPPLEFDLKGLKAQRALYAHLDEPVAPPISPGKLDVAFIEAVRQKLSPEKLELWAKLVGPSKNSPKRVALLVSVPRTAGGLSLIGAAFGARGGMVDPQAEVMPLTVRRHTPAYMRERGGASLDLYGKHVVILGCGAVGSVVADALAASGVGRLTLVDGDDYSEDNVFRHILDPLWVDAPKVLGLKYKFERHYPGITVTQVPSWGQEWLKTARFDDVDAVVFAFGLPTLERWFNRALRTFKKQLPVLFTWIEPLDLGGHSVVVWAQCEGCLDCLYRDDEGAPALHARTSFLEPNQAVSKNLTGCSSVFVPFGALQSRRTGLMAAEHVLATLIGDTGPSYRYWVGEGRAAAAQGLRVTPWWNEARSVTFTDATSRVFGRPCRRCRSAE